MTDSLCGADPLDPREDKSECFDAHAQAFLVGRASQLAPGLSQAARQYR